MLTNFAITRAESERAKAAGMTAQLLRADLFTTALMQTREYFGQFPAPSQHIFRRDTVEAAIDCRSIRIMIHAGIISVCGAGYMYRPDAIDNDAVSAMHDALEQYYFDDAV